MESIVTTGLVIREVRYKEADRILTLLTPKLGVITASAKGSLRLKNKLFTACGLFSYSEFTLVPGRNMYSVQEAEIKNTFRGISDSIEGMSLAMYLTEFAAVISPVGEEADKELRLLLNCLYLISEKMADLRIIKAVFELRTMSECGFMPQLLCCRECNRYEAESFYLDLEEGTLLCPDCAKKKNVACNLDAGALFALRHICLVADKKVFSFKLSRESLLRLGRVTERYAAVHLDKPLKSYSFLKSVLPDL